MNATIVFPAAALANIDETSADWRADAARLVADETTAASLLDECLDGADDDRVQGWREYVEALEEYAAPRRRTLKLALRGLDVTRRKRTVEINDESVRWATTRAAWDEAIETWGFAGHDDDEDELAVRAYDRLCSACCPCVILGGNAGDSGTPEELSALRAALVADGAIEAQETK